MKCALLIYGERQAMSQLDEAAMPEVRGGHMAYGRALTEAVVPA